MSLLDTTKKIAVQKYIAILIKQSSKITAESSMLLNQISSQDFSNEQTLLRVDTEQFRNSSFNVGVQLKKIDKSNEQNTITTTQIKALPKYRAQIRYQKEVLNELKSRTQELISNSPTRNYRQKETKEENTQFKQQFYDNENSKPMQEQSGVSQNHPDSKIEDTQQKYDNTNKVEAQQQTNTQTQTKSQTTPASNESTAENNQPSQPVDTNYEKEVIKQNKAFVVETQNFFSTLSFNDPSYQEKINNFIQTHSDFFDERAINDPSLESIKEQLSNSLNNIRHSQKNLGEAYIHKNGESEINDAWHEMDSSNEVNPSKTFKSIKGTETTYEHFNESNGTAIINFDEPIIEADTTKAGVGYNAKTGQKMYFGEVKTSKVNGVCVKVSENGLINFNLPQNKELLSHPEIISEIIKQYPESFKTLPTVVYASDPKLFAESFKEGTIKKAESGKLGKQSVEDYYLNADFELGQMNTKAIEQHTNVSEAQKKAIEAVNKQVQIEQESQMGE